MKLSYKVEGSGGSFTVLGDESDRVTTLELAAPQYARAAQVEALVRAESVATFDRANVSVAHQIVVTTTYTTLALALASEAAFAVLFTGKVRLKLEQGTTVLYYPNAVFTSYSPGRNGTTVRHALQFVSQQVTTVEA
jgi:hypothetical protein